MQVDLISNKGVTNVGQLLEEDFEKCTHFDIAVAFITEHSLELLNLYLKKNKYKGRHGRLLIGVYKSFNSKEILYQLSKLDPKIEVKISTNPRFHWKYYRFEFVRKQHVYIGSANFTKDGLESTGEIVCKLQLSASEQSSSKVYKKIFDEEWEDSKPIKEFPISKYKQAPSVAKNFKQASEVQKFFAKKELAKSKVNSDIQRVELIVGELTKATVKIISKNQSHWDKNNWGYFTCSGKAEYDYYSKVTNIFIIERNKGEYYFSKAEKTGECNINTPDGRYFIAYKQVGRARKITKERREKLESLGIKYFRKSYFSKAIGKNQSQALLDLLS
jgi:HKD family nuclease